MVYALSWAVTNRNWSLLSKSSAACVRDSAGFPSTACACLFSSLSIAAVVIWVIYVIRNTNGTIYSVFRKTLIRGCENVKAKSLKEQ